MTGIDRSVLPAFSSELEQLSQGTSAFLFPVASSSFGAVAEGAGVTAPFKATNAVGAPIRD
jgi:hypothetical protein